MTEKLGLKYTKIAAKPSRIIPIRDKLFIVLFLVL